MQWQRASGCVPSDVTQFKVSRLDEGQTYLFQVSAENDQGCGPALMTQFETLAKNPFGLSCYHCFLRFMCSAFLCLCQATAIDCLLEKTLSKICRVRHLTALTSCSRMWYTCMDDYTYSLQRWLAEGREEDGAKPARVVVVQLNIKEVVRRFVRSHSQRLFCILTILE